MSKLLKYFIMVFALCFTVSVLGQTTTWRDMYKVKKKDTIFGIAKKYGVTIPELIKANPEMGNEGYELKKDDYIFIPFTGNNQQSSTNRETTSNTINQTISKQTKGIKIGVMLPLHNEDGDGNRMVEYYRGLLMACENLKKEGVSTDIHAWNIKADNDIRQTLIEKDASTCDIIFGPLYTKQVKYLASFCKVNNIKLVIPFSINGDDVTSNSNIYQVYQSTITINNKTIDAFMERFPQYHPIFIDCNDTTSRKGNFTFNLRKRLEAKGINYNITNLTSSEASFANAFSETSQNIVILNSGRSPALNVALAKIDGLKSKNPQLRISLFGYTEWFLYTKTYLEYFHKYDTYIPSTYFYNPLSQATTSFDNYYRLWFKSDMISAIPRFALVGYDHGQFFLRGIYKYGKSFVGTKNQNIYKPIQSPLSFKRIGTYGGYINSTFMLVHYKNNDGLETINY